ncbi:MAG TPA: NADH:flavin oxidoreductase [Terriglobia bacterium]|nr:NADH:flavin oxidoreductase [Terriglobia bacterium]
MAAKSYPRVASLRTASAVAERFQQLGWRLPFDETILTAPSSPLAQPLEISWHDGIRRIGNRFAVQPMEGWDGEPDGRPSDLTRRRWLRFASSGAKLIWGGEAVAVLPEARANPNQLLLNSHTALSLEALRRDFLSTHRERFGKTDDLLLGLQLTHSGRFCRPYEKNRLDPVIAYRHPILDKKFGISPQLEPVSDVEVERIVQAFGEAARLAQDIGFDFVDLKHCHGYLGHEFLGAFERPGPYGETFENRTRLLREMVAVVRDRAPGLEIGVRLSAYDTVPFMKDPETGEGYPAKTPDGVPYRWGFGVNRSEPIQTDLTETKGLLRLLVSLGVRLVNITASSPYYAPHLSRPALFPPCDGYLPPEDPLAGVARLLTAARELKAASPELIFVSTGWSYLQNFLPHFAQAAVRGGWTDAVGLGRMMLSYPDLPADVLEKGQLDAKRICRTFSDCTNGPRNGFVSGCYPLDPFYKARPEAEAVKAVKLRMNQRPAEAVKPA